MNVFDNYNSAYIVCFATQNKPLYYNLRRNKKKILRGGDSERDIPVSGDACFFAFWGWVWWVVTPSLWTGANCPCCPRDVSPHFEAPTKRNECVLVNAWGFQKRYVACMVLNIFCLCLLFPEINCFECLKIWTKFLCNKVWYYSNIQRDLNSKFSPFCAYITVFVFLSFMSD